MKHFVGADPIKFGNTKNLDASLCLMLLNKYIPEYMKERKISQKLFIKSVISTCIVVITISQIHEETL